MLIGFALIILMYLVLYLTHNLVLSYICAAFIGLGNGFAVSKIY